MTMVRKIVAPACICDPNPSGKLKNVLSCLISNSSPIMYSPMKSDIRNLKFFILRDLIDDHPKKINDIEKRIDVIIDIYGMVSGLKSRNKLFTSLLLFFSSTDLFY